MKIESLYSVPRKDSEDVLSSEEERESLRASHLAKYVDIKRYEVLANRKSSQNVNSSWREPPLLFLAEKSDEEGAVADEKAAAPPQEPAPDNHEADQAAARAGIKLEFIGTLLLAFAAALSPNTPLVLAALLYMTGGHLNPAVTTVLALTGNLPEASSGFICGVYPIIQIIAAIGGNMIAGLFISSRAASPDAPPSIPKAGGTGGLVLRESSCGPRPSPPVEFRREVVGARGPLPYRMHGIMSSSHD